MSLKSDIFDALKSLVANRVTPDRFDPNPTCPAIRVTIVGGAAAIDLEGDGDASTDDVRIQLDWIGSTQAERDELTPLIRAAMKTIDPPCVMQGPTLETFDAETKLFRATADWIAYGSSTT